MNQNKPESKKERRRFPRLSSQIWAVEKNENSRSFHLVTNLSMEGFFIDKKLPFPVGEIVNFELDLDGETVPVQGKIINNYDVPEKNKSGAGVQFVEMDEKAEARIEAFIKKLHSAGRTER